MFIWFALGVASGLGFLYADEKYFVKYYQEDKSFLVTRSPLFLLALMPIAIMVITSFGSFWASGVVGGMMLWLVLEMLIYRSNPEVFAPRFLQGVKVKSIETSMRLMLIIGWSFFIVVHLLGVF